MSSKYARFAELEDKFEKSTSKKLEEAFDKIDRFIYAYKTEIKNERRTDDGKKADGEGYENLRDELRKLRDGTLVKLKERIDGWRDDIRWMEQAS